jgi:hypothetical protein
MNSQIEAELRAALELRAAELPGDPGARLAALDYHPRTHRLRRPAALGALAGAAGTAGVVISLVGGAADAFAGWSAVPTRPSPDQLAAAAAHCQSRSPIAGLPLKLTDSRGPFTFQIYADASSSAECVSGPSFLAVTTNQSNAPRPVADNGLLADHVSSHLTYRGGRIFSFADGNTGSSVSAVSLILDDGSRVQATVQNGWYVAWWPGARELKRAELTTADGTRTQDFPAVPAVPTVPATPCPTGNCAGGEAGSTSSSGGGRNSGRSTSFGIVQRG